MQFALEIILILFVMVLYMALLGSIQGISLAIDKRRKEQEQTNVLLHHISASLMSLDLSARKSTKINDVEIKNMWQAVLKYPKEEEKNHTADKP